MQRITWLMFGVLLGCVTVVQGTNRYVSLTGNSTTPYTNWADAATNIQYAVDVSGTGDIIYITNGTYTLTNQVSIAKRITLEGFNGSSNTFINGNYPNTTNRCIYVTDDSGVVIISGLTISNGYAATNTVLGYEPYGNGGGVYLLTGLIRNCVISNNSSEWKGGGVYLAGSTATITNSTITWNYSGPTAFAYGGGGVCGDGASKVQNCTLSFNFATNSGGGVLMIGAGLVENCVISNNIGGGNAGGFSTFGGATIRNCVVVQNRVRGGLNNGGGGIRVDHSYTVQNCLIMNNTSGDVGGGIWVIGNGGNISEIRNCTVVSNSAAVSGGGIWSYGVDNPRIINTIIYSNTAPVSLNHNDSGATFTNCCTTPLPALGTGNITNYPQLADWTNNYRLIKSSPCINTGTNQTWMTGAVDLDGHRRIDRLYGRVDMGAYEFIHKITMFSGH